MKGLCFCCLQVLLGVMELKVWVDGVARVVCGLTLSTSCKDVVIARAQSLGNSRCSQSRFYPYQKLLFAMKSAHFCCLMI